MKKKYFLFIFLLYGVACFFVNLQAKEKIFYIEEEGTSILTHTRKNKKVCGSSFKPLRVSGFVNYPPFGWVEQKQSLKKQKVLVSYNQGVGFVLFEKIAKDLGVTVANYTFQSYKKAQEAIQLGQTDLLLGTYYDKSQYSPLDMVYPAYLKNPFIIVSMKGRFPPITHFSELAAKKGVMRKEEYILPLIQELLPNDVHVVEVSGARNAFKKLMSNEADFMLTSQYAFEAEVRRFKIREQFDVSDTIFYKPTLFFAFSQIGDCAPLHKKVIENKLKKLVEDDNFITVLILSQIELWENKFKDDPPLSLDETPTFSPILEENKDEGEEESAIQDKDFLSNEKNN